MIQLPSDHSRFRAWPAPREGARQLPPPLTPYDDLIVNFCPTGTVPTKATTPHVPISPSEVIDQACDALERGAAIVHLHAREDDGTPTYRGEIYEKMILGIRAEFPEAITCVSCSGRTASELERRSEVLELTGAARPDMASLTLTTLDYPTGTSRNAPDMVIALAEKMIAKGIKPELECFDYGMISAANTLIGKGLLGDGPHYFNLFFGSPYSVPATAKHLAGMVEDLPEDSVWSAAGIGLFQLPMNALAIAMGGHTRVGLEDNIFHGFDRSELATNQGLVERVADLSETFGRLLATPSRARAMLGLGEPAAVRHRVGAGFAR
jgi:uncharacterized protein (DUF849 family)